MSERGPQDSAICQHCSLEASRLASPLPTLVRTQVFCRLPSLASSGRYLEVTWHSSCFLSSLHCSICSQNLTCPHFGQKALAFSDFGEVFRANKKMSSSTQPRKCEPVNHLSFAPLQIPCYPEPSGQGRVTSGLSLRTVHITTCL